MEKIISEIGYGVFVIGLIALVLIGVYKNSMDVVTNSANNINNAEKIKIEDFIGTSQTTLKGGEVIGIIRYYANDASVEVYVTTNANGSKSYITETYDKATFPIPYESTFTQTIERDGNGEITKITLTEQ